MPRSRARRLSIAAVGAVGLPLLLASGGIGASAAGGDASRVVLRAADPAHDAATTTYRYEYAATDSRRTLHTEHGVGNDIRRVTVSVVGDRLRVALTTRFDYSEDYRADLRLTTAAGGVYHAGRYVNSNEVPDVGSYFERRGTKDARCHVRSVANDAGLVVEVPLSCLGGPSWVRLGVETWGIYPIVGQDSHEAISYDDAFRAGPSSAARAAQHRDRLYAGKGYGTMSGRITLR